MLSLFTSGSTDEPKQITHSWQYINECANRSVQEIQLTCNDRVLDVFPANTIAHWTITAYPSVVSGAQLHTAVFNPYEYIEYFKRIQPTYISLIPRHYEVLKGTKGFKTLDMNCVRYMVTGSGSVSQELIDAFRERGVKTVANWYGMTEVPPPVMVGYNTTNFTKMNEDISFSNEGECIINDWKTGDIFDVSTMTFSHRRKSPNGKTWKTEV